MKRSTARWGVVLLASALLTRAPTAQAEWYQVQVTRIGNDVYLEEASRLVILTRYCYVYVYSQLAILDYERGSALNELIFPSPLRERCAVQGVYAPNAALTRVAYNLYRDDDSGRYVRTQMCLALALSEDAVVLRDRVIFLDSREVCDR
jgi:hypothetical protein